MSEVGSSLGKTSVISDVIAVFMMLFFFIIQSVLISPLIFLNSPFGFVLILAPIAIITGLVGIGTDKRKIYAILGLIFGVFLCMSYFLT